MKRKKDKDTNAILQKAGKKKQKINHQDNTGTFVANSPDSDGGEDIVSRSAKNKLLFPKSKIVNLSKDKKESYNSKVGKDIFKIVEKGDVNEVAPLLEGIKDINILNHKGEKWSLLHHAVYGNNLPVIKLLIKCKIDVNIYDQAKDITPLHLAVRQKKPNIKLIEVLLKAGADPSKQDMGGENALHKMGSDNVEIAKLILDFSEDEKALINMLDDQKWNSVKLAIFSKHNNILRYLLENGAVMKDDYLFFAAQMLNTGAIKVLREYIDLEITDDDGLNIADYALTELKYQAERLDAEYIDESIMEYLLEQGIEPLGNVNEH